MSIAGFESAELRVARLATQQYLYLASIVVVTTPTTIVISGVGGFQPDQFELLTGDFNGNSAVVVNREVGKVFRSGRVLTVQAGRFEILCTEWTDQRHISRRCRSQEGKTTVQVGRMPWDIAVMPQRLGTASSAGAVPLVVLSLYGTEPRGISQWVVPVTPGSRCASHPDRAGMSRRC
jgi:hypothetical protein